VILLFDGIPPTLPRPVPIKQTVLKPTHFVNKLDEREPPSAGRPLPDLLCFIASRQFRDGGTIGSLGISQLKYGFNLHRGTQGKRGSSKSGANADSAIVSEHLREKLTASIDD